MLGDGKSEDWQRELTFQLTDIQFHLIYSEYLFKIKVFWNKYLKMITYFWTDVVYLMSF
jgi:hypothetical protein